VVIALDGPIDSLLSTDEAPPGDVTGEVWRELAAQVAGLLAAVTVRDLVVRAQARNPASAAPQMYFI
jgi:hypothetical protein